MDRPDLYVLLGVQPDATAAELQAAYRERVRVFHPDRFDRTSQPEEWAAANRLLRELNAAYHVLSDRVRRAEYDSQFSDFTSAMSSPGSGESHTQRPTNGVRRPERSLRLFFYSCCLGIVGLTLTALVIGAIKSAPSPSAKQEVERQASVPASPPTAPPVEAVPTKAEGSRFSGLVSFAPTEPTVSASEKVGCGGDERSELPADTTHWYYDSRNRLAPFEVLTSGDRHFFVRLEEDGRPVASMLLRPGSTAEISVPLGRFTLEYATGDGTYWCGQDSKKPFGEKTSFYRAVDTFHFRDAGDHYEGYTVELILKRDGNLPTKPIPPEEW